MKNIILFILIINVITSCKNPHQHRNNEPNENAIKFSVPKNKEKDNINQYNASQFYSNLSGFELDRKGGAIGLVDKIYIYENKLFVLDSRYSHKLYAYDINHEGKFLFAIGKLGKGPGEFTSLSDFTIDSLNNEVLIIDMQQKKICYYDLSGNFLKERKLNFTPEKILCEREYIYFICATYNEKDTGIKVTDKKLKLLKEYLPSKSYPTLTITGSGFFKFGNKVILNYPNCDTIFQFDGLSKKPYFILETGENSLYTYMTKNNVDFKEKISLMTNRNKNSEFNTVIIPQTYYEDNYLIWFSFRTGGIQFKKVLYAKNSNEPRPTLGFLRDDIAGLPVNFKFFNSKYGSVNTVDPSAVIKAKIELIEKNRNKISQQLIYNIKNADIDCNPFVIFYK